MQYQIIPNNRILVISIYLLIIITGVATGGVAATEDENQSSIIHQNVSERDGEVKVLVQFEEPTTAELSAADTKRTLKQEAVATQQPLNELADQTPGVTVERNFWITNAAIVTVDTETVDITEIAALEDVSSISPSVELETAAAGGTTERTQNSSGSIQSPSRPITPSVSDVDQHISTTADTTYGLEQLNVPKAWADYETRGEGVRVAVLDTGVDPDHPAIELYTDDPTDPTYPSGWAEFNWNGAKISGSEPYDINGHGTHVSGTVAGENEGSGHIGVAPEANLMHGSVLGPNGGTNWAGIGGIEWAVQNDADIISMSLSTSEPSESFAAAVRNARQQGVIVIAASGNKGPGTSGSPANVPESVAVGATDSSASVTSFSSGTTIDTDTTWDSPPVDWPDEYVVPTVVAPGSNVVSAIPGGRYGYLSGTSMATPHIAGTAALMQSKTDERLSPTEIENALIESAWKPDGRPVEQDIRYGHGIADAHAAVTSVSSATDDAPIAGEATRSIEHDAVVPGDKTTVSINVDVRRSGSFVIDETITSEPVTVSNLETTLDGRHVEPTFITTTEHGVTTAFDLETDSTETLTVTYNLGVEPTAAGDKPLKFNGTVADQANTSNIAGEQRIKIDVERFEEKYLREISNSEGTIKADELRTGIRDWRSNEIRDSFLLDIINAWQTGEQVTN